MIENVEIPNNKRLAILKMYQSFSGVQVICIEDVPEVFITECLNLPEDLLLKNAVSIELQKSKLSLKCLSNRYGVGVQVVRTIAAVLKKTRKTRVALRGQSN